MRSDSQLKRMLKLVPYLQKHQGITIHETAEHFGITPAQVLGDLEVLQFCGLPDGLYDDLFDVDLDGARDDGHIFFRNAEVLAAPMRISRAEAMSLLAALGAVVEVSGGSPAATSAVAKLRGALGIVEDEMHVDVDSGRPEHVSLLQEAIEASRVVRLRYTGGPGSSSTEPVVEPARLRAVDGYGYLDAWSRDREAWRSYRLDRVDGVSLTTEGFEPRLAPGGEEWFSEVTDELTLDLAPEAAWVVEYYPTRSVERLPDRVRVTVPVASKAWATALLLRLGDGVLEASDATVATEAAQRAAAAVALHEALG